MNQPEVYEEVVDDYRIGIFYSFHIFQALGIVSGSHNGFKKGLLFLFTSLPDKSK